MFSFTASYDYHVAPHTVDVPAINRGKRLTREHLPSSRGLSQLICGRPDKSALASSHFRGCCQTATWLRALLPKDVIKSNVIIIAGNHRNLWPRRGRLNVSVERFETVLFHIVNDGGIKWENRPLRDFFSLYRLS